MLLGKIRWVLPSSLPHSWVREVIRRDVKLIHRSFSLVDQKCDSTKTAGGSDINLNIVPSVICLLLFGSLDLVRSCDNKQLKGKRIQWEEIPSIATIWLTDSPLLAYWGTFCFIYIHSPKQRETEWYSLTSQYAHALKYKDIWSQIISQTNLVR